MRYALSYFFDNNKPTDFLIAETLEPAGNYAMRGVRITETFGTLAEAIDRQRELSGWKNAHAVLSDNGARIIKGKGISNNVYETNRGSVWINQGWWKR